MLKAAWKIMPRYCDALRLLQQRLQKAAVLSAVLLSLRFLSFLALAVSNSHGYRANQYVSKQAAIPTLDGQFVDVLHTF